MCRSISDHLQQLRHQSANYKMKDTCCVLFSFSLIWLVPLFMERERDKNTVKVLDLFKFLFLFDFATLVFSLPLLSDRLFLLVYVNVCFMQLVLLFVFIR